MVPSRDPVLVARLVEAVDTCITSLGSFPSSGHPVQATTGQVNYRRAKVLGFPYWLVFRLKGETIQVVAVAHERRRPDYWSK